MELKSKSSNSQKSLQVGTKLTAVVLAVQTFSRCQQKQEWSGSLPACSFFFFSWIKKHLFFFRKRGQVCFQPNSHLNALSDRAEHHQERHQRQPQRPGGLQAPGGGHSAAHAIGDQRVTGMQREQMAPVGCVVMAWWWLLVVTYC